jgi:hypothetical protein
MSGLIERMRLLQIAVLSLLIASFSARPAHALDRDARAIFVASGYGILLGTALGLVALPTTKSAKAVFVGSSLGLYLGLAVGIYHITHRDDPENPFRAERGRTLLHQPHGRRSGKSPDSSSGAAY